jgi:hypothetical protein
LRRNRIFMWKANVHRTRSRCKHPCPATSPHRPLPFVLFVPFMVQKQPKPFNHEAHKNHENPSNLRWGRLTVERLHCASRRTARENNRVSRKNLKKPLRAGQDPSRRPPFFASSFDFCGNPTPHPSRLRMSCLCFTNTSHAKNRPSTERVFCSNELAVCNGGAG